MNFIAWNCKGTRSQDFSQLVMDIREYSASLVCLFETHPNKGYAKRIIKRVEFDGSFIQKTWGHLDGIWCL